jgi:hypothetical protein
MTGELQIASTHGSPLARLLAEIDGYVSDRTGSGGEGTPGRRRRP